MKQIILTLIFSVATAINSFAIDWGKADIGAFEDSQSYGSYPSDTFVYTLSGIVGGLIILLLIISKIAEYIDKNKK
jgi:hypothetical protein